jgi:hypothetical protein
MNKIFFFSLTAALALSTLTAQADFKKGRVRVDAKGNLNASQSTGVFHKIKHAIVLQEVTDGVGVTGYLLLTPRGEVHFKLRKTRDSMCGPVYAAQSDSERGINLRIRDSGNYPDCRIPHEWIIEISKGKSRLVLEGAPRRYMLTQGGDDGSLLDF